MGFWDQGVEHVIVDKNNGVWVDINKEMAWGDFEASAAQLQTGDLVNDQKAQIDGSLKLVATGLIDWNVPDKEDPSKILAHSTTEETLESLRKLPKSVTLRLLEIVAKSFAPEGNDVSDAQFPSQSSGSD